MPYNSHNQNFKNAVKLNLTEDSCVPMECRKAHQMMMTVKKLVNALTGEVRYQLTEMRPIAYEFECEALADYKYGISNAHTNNKTEEGLLSQIGSKKNLDGMNI